MLVGSGRASFAIAPLGRGITALERLIKGGAYREELGLQVYRACRADFLWANSRADYMAAIESIVS
jgi:hypothetical protein